MNSDHVSMSLFLTRIVAKRYTVMGMFRVNLTRLLLHLVVRGVFSYTCDFYFSFLEKSGSKLHTLWQEREDSSTR